MQRKVKGITKTYFLFNKFLRRNRKKISVLQLTGRIEDYLVSEFIYHFFRNSDHNKYFALPNIGKLGEQKIDICFLRASALPKREIFAMVEAKYLRNCHRLSIQSSAEDEISTTLVSLKKQLHSFRRKKQGGYRVCLSSPAKQIYGLVFCSYVCSVKNKQDKERYFRKIIKEAEKHFCYHDLPKPYLVRAFDDQKIRVLRKTYLVSLRTGLWRSR